MSRTCTADVLDPIGNDFALLDPDPYLECGSESNSRSGKTDQNQHISMISSLSKKALALFFHDLKYYIKYNFQLFVTATPNQDTDPDRMHGTAFGWLLGGKKLDHVR
jgi:hypothetical protein